MNLEMMNMSPTMTIKHMKRQESALIDKFDLIMQRLDAIEQKLGIPAVKEEPLHVDVE